MTKATDSQQLPNLQRRRAVVTGGSRGIGASIVRALVAGGHDVVVGYRSGTEAATALADEMAATGARAHALRVDVADPDDVPRFIDAAADWLGGIDVLCCNAGVEYFAGPDDVDVGAYDRVFATNTRGTYLCIQHALPHLAEQDGRIVCTSSMSATTAVPNHAIYSASKAAVEAMVAGLALDLAPRGVRINAIAPGGTMTEMVTEVATTYGSLLDAGAFRLPFGRLAEPEEIARAAAFLASDDSAWITGQTIRVAGGQ